MKKLLSLLIALQVVLAFSCEKNEDQIVALEVSSNEAPAPTHEQTLNAPTVAGDALEKSPMIQVIRDVEYDLPANTWYGYFVNRADLPDPLQRKQQALLSKTLGVLAANPNLYIYAYDNETRVFRLIRSSTRAAAETDIMSFRSSDLKYSEERIYVGAYSRDYAAKIRMTTTARAVDCVEYAPAEQVVLSHGQQVQGCDGKFYNNSSFAVAAGVTSWTLLW